jgi:hypothetical protein
MRANPLHTPYHGRIRIVGHDCEVTEGGEWDPA